MILCGRRHVKGRFGSGRIVWIVSPTGFLHVVDGQIVKGNQILGGRTAACIVIVISGPPAGCAVGILPRPPSWGFGTEWWFVVVTAGGRHN